MTLLTAATALAKNVGIAVPEIIVLSSDRDAIELQQTLKEAADELARRVDWLALQSYVSLGGTGTSTTFDLPPGADRLTRGAAVSFQTKPLRALSLAEWQQLVPTQGTPRYYITYNMSGSGLAELELYPYMSGAVSADVLYQTRYWSSNDTDTWDTDDTTSVLDEDLIVKCAIVKWRRRKGMDYADFEAEYEAALADAAVFDTGGRP